MQELDINRLNFDSPTALAAALADRVAAELSLAVMERQQAVLAVSGGNTPELFFHHLSKIDLDWKKIMVTLVDERFVPLDDDRSNEGFVRKHLLQNYAAQARFYSLYHKAITSELAAFSAASRVNALPRPFDVVVLGMGLDGHTASFFPGGDRLKEALDPKSRALVLPMHAKGVGEPRLTLTLPLICDAQFIALHVEGYDKLTVLEQAFQEGAITDMPIRAVLKYAHHPLQIYWSPKEGEKMQTQNNDMFSTMHIM